MRLKVQLPRVENSHPQLPEECPYGCGCEHFSTRSGGEIKGN